jgi:hypothetical protein
VSWLEPQLCYWKLKSSSSHDQVTKLGLNTHMVGAAAKMGNTQLYVQWLVHELSWTQRLEDQRNGLRNCKSFQLSGQLVPVLGSHSSLI